MKAVLATIPNLSDDEFEIHPDILEAIQANSQAWENFQGFSLPYIRIRVAFIGAARKQPAEFKKRLRYFIKMTEKNKQFGFGRHRQVLLSAAGLMRRAIEGKPRAA